MNDFPDEEPIEAPNFNILTFDIGDGRIKCIFNNLTQSEVELNTQDGEGAFIYEQEAEHNWNSYYILDGKLAERPIVTVSNSAGASPFQLDLSGFAAGSIATITNEDGEALQIDDMDAELMLTDAGFYEVAIDQPFPYYELNYKVTVT